MKKKKSKKNKKKKEKPFNYKLLFIIAGVFNFIVYATYYSTLYNDTLFWGSLIFCGVLMGVYFIKKMKLLEPSSYRKIEGLKLKLYMLFICFFMIIGTTLIFGNLINGGILGLNYFGGNHQSTLSEHTIQKIEKRRRGTKRYSFRRNVPEVHLVKDGEIIQVTLKERYSSTINYSEYKTIELNISKGLFGFEIIDSYKLIK